MDRKDDIKVGVKSAAVLLGEYVKPALCFFAATFVTTLVVAGVVNKQGPAYFIISCGGASVHFAWQLTTLRQDDPKDCEAKFKVSPGIQSYPYVR